MSWKWVVFFLTIQSFNLKADTIHGAPEKPWFCAYYYTQYKWGIHFARGGNKDIAFQRTMNRCTRHNGKKCNKKFIECRRDEYDRRYLCTYYHRKFGLHIGRSTNSLEALIMALNKCEKKNQKKCKKDFVTCLSEKKG
jgi:hypothetical protein